MAFHSPPQPSVRPSVLAVGKDSGASKIKQKLVVAIRIYLSRVHVVVSKRVGVPGASTTQPPRLHVQKLYSILSTLYAGIFQN